MVTLWDQIHFQQTAQWIVSVADNSHGLAVGDVIDLCCNRRRLDLNVAFRVGGVTDANNYTVTATSNATSSVAGMGAQCRPNYPRISVCI